MRRVLLSTTLALVMLVGAHASLAEAQASGSCDAGNGQAGTLTAQGDCVALQGATGSCDANGRPGTLDGNGTCVPDLTGSDTTSDSSRDSVSQNPFGNTSGRSGGINMGYIQGYADDITYVFNSILVPLLIAVAFFYFLLGVYQYFILGASDSKKLETGRSFVQWSVIGFAAIFSVWGLVWIVLNTFGLRPGGGPPSYPFL